MCVLWGQVREQAWETHQLGFPLLPPDGPCGKTRVKVTGLRQHMPFQLQLSV